MTFQAIAYKGEERRDRTGKLSLMRLTLPFPCLLTPMLFNDPTRTSTLLLSSLMVIGLVFFIRASAKDRIEVAQFSSVQEADALRQAVISYFYSRAYQPLSKASAAAPLDADRPSNEQSSPEISDKAASAGVTIINGTTLVGMVSPSVFMAVFLSLLAAVGFACLSLIVATLFPVWGGWLLLLVAASPLAGVFYWRKSSRLETVVLRVDSLVDANRSELTAASEPASRDQGMSKLIIKGHRDELADLENAFSQPKLKVWAQLEKISPS